MSSLCSLVSVIISIHQPFFVRTSVHYGQHSSLWIIPVNPLKAPSAFAEYNARRRVARSPYLPAGEAQKPPFAESEHLRTPPAGTTDICKTCRFISIRSRPRHSRGRQSNNAVAIPLLPIQPRRSGSIWRATSGWTAPSLRSSSASTPRIELGTNVIRHRGTEKNLRRSRHAHESVGQQASRQRFGGCDLEWLVSQYARTAAANSCIAIGWRQPSGP